jgi:hypothetical protein
MLKWILLAISVASLAFFIYRVVAYQRGKAECDREWHG